MTAAQRETIAQLAEGFGVPVDPDTFIGRFDLPDGWVAGWVGPIYVGISPEGDAHS